jgi:hypothetical protein
MSTKTISSKPTRITFTFAKSKELDKLVISLEKRLSGLSKAEIVKLALVELNNTLSIRDKNSAYIEYMSDSYAQELVASKNSGYSHELKSSQDIDNYLDGIIK